MVKSHSDRNHVAVPSTLVEVLDPQWLHWALDDIDETDEILSVVSTGHSKTLADKARFLVELVAADGQRRSRAYCVKAHFDDGPRTLAPEAKFYRDLAPRLDMRMPRAYYAAADDQGRGLIVMDDVIGSGGRFLGAHEPYSVEVTKDSLEQLARLHAATWADPRPAGCGWLQPSVSMFQRIYDEARLGALLNDGRAEGLAPELRDPTLVHAALGSTAHRPQMCVVHGDTHSGNVYLDAHGRACWLDWQVTQPGHWSTDVAYHLATVLDVDTRRRHEQDLLRHYLAVLERLGVAPPSWDEAWDWYRSGFSFGYFLWVITSISSRSVVMIHMPRLGTAMADHDTFRRLGLVD